MSTSRRVWRAHWLGCGSLDNSYGVSPQLLESKDAVVGMFRAYLILRSSRISGTSRKFLHK